jgi:cytidylate kinase
MNPPLGLEHCLSFINCHLQPPARPSLFSETGARKAAITISRQSGCGAHVVAEKVATSLQAGAVSDDLPWRVCDRDLVETVLADHQLPEGLARFMPEDSVPEIDNIMDELFGLHPPLGTLVQKTAETILRLAEQGNVIILGRGANVITARLPHVLHVRMVASPERRIEHMQQFEGLTRKAAAERIRREDQGRQRYLKKHFDKDIDDPLLYHLVLNTDLVSLDNAARMITELVLNRTTVPAA